MKTAAIELKNGPLVTVAKCTVSKVENSNVTRNSNLAAMESVAGVVEIVKLVSAVMEPRYCHELGTVKLPPLSPRLTGRRAKSTDDATMMSLAHELRSSATKAAKGRRPIGICVSFETFIPESARRNA
jgi:hypothetical protein